MNFKFFFTLIVFLVMGSLAWQAAANNPQLFGDPMPGLTAEQLTRFDEGKDEFSEEETVADGLGPVFNGKSCAECHSGPAVGGDSDITETRFGKMTNHRFDPLTQFGGSLIQSQGIGPVDSCNIAGEVAPSQATITAERKTTPFDCLGAGITSPHFLQVRNSSLSKNLW